MNNFYSLIALVILLGGCAAPQGLRDADGQPRLARLSAATPVEPGPRIFTLRDVARMERDGLDPQAIIERLRLGGQRFSMDAAQQQQLREAGGSPALIDTMIVAETQALQTDKLTKEADEAAQRREEALRYYYNDYYAWRSFYPYAGYSSYNGWYGGAGWYW